MKVKITESQYNRLLTENTGDEWGRVSKTVDAFTIKVFKKIRDKIQNGGLKMNSDIVDYIVNSLVLTQEEAIILTHNFKVMVDLHSQDDLNELLGKPMEFMGIWQIPTHVPTVVELTGRGYPEGRVYVMGRTPQEALSTITHGSEDDFEVGDMNELDLDAVLDEFDIDIVDDIPQKGMVKDDFYEGEDGRGNKFEALPYIKDDVSMGVQSLQHDLSRKKLNNLLKNIG
jgi:hypothetical protein